MNWEALLKLAAAAMILKTVMSVTHGERRKVTGASRISCLCSGRLFIFCLARHIRTYAVNYY